jgi:hypothetical protein
MWVLRLLEAAMARAYAHLTVEVGEVADSDAEELAELTNRLRNELLEFDVDAVELTSTREAPDSSKGVGLLAAGGLVVRFALGDGRLQSIIDGIRAWLARQHRRSIKLTLEGDSLELTGVTSAEQDRLVEFWLKRHANTG